VLSALLEYREADLLAQGRSSSAGFYRLAWRDEVDDSPQYARLVLPPDYDPARRYPLVVNLHGHSSQNPPYAARDQGNRHERLVEQYDVIWMAPDGRGNSGYRGIGEADVMRAIAEACKYFSVDADRIYLTGSSMGGGGAWYLGSRHTDVFAAIAPVYGGWDYHAYATAAEAAAWPPLRRLFEEAGSSFAQVECLLHTPVFVNVGDKDSRGLVGSQRYVVRMLQRWGYDVRYWEHPGKGHGGLPSADAIVTWFLTHKLDRAPRHVRLRSADLSGANAHWVHVQQREDPFAFMLVDAEIGRGNVIRVDSQNVLELRLTPPAELLGADRPVKVVWNEAPAFEGPLPADGAITLRAEGYTPGAFCKKPMVATPFAIVAGTTSKDERTKRICRLLADRRREAWKIWQHVEPRFFIDTEMTDEQIRSYSLILVGGPAENAVTAKLIRDIPLTLALDGITIDGRTFPARDAAVFLTYAHPLNPDRLVAVIAGTSADGLFHAQGLNDDIDFAIGDGRITTEEAGFSCLVAWGRFDHAWRRNDKYIQLGDPSARAAAPVRKVPRYVAAAVAGAKLPLSDLLEIASCGSFATMGRDRNWQGRAITLGGRTYASGLAVQTWSEPCKATWDLSGAGGGWKRLRATLGIEPDVQAAKEDPVLRDRTRITFVVRGDGKELYTSPVFTFTAAPVAMTVDVSGVQRLELEVRNEGLREAATASVNWADIRLEK
jgi:hypothetical protein